MASDYFHTIGLNTVCRALSIHDQQRDEISDAVLRIAARDGLGGVTMSHVAARLRVSKGSVQHYFASKRELLLHASRRLRPASPNEIDATARRATRRRMSLGGVLGRMLPATSRSQGGSHAGQAPVHRRV